MLRLRVRELLKERNKTPYWLNKQLGMSFQNFSKMINNETSSIQYKNIEAKLPAGKTVKSNFVEQA